MEYTIIIEKSKNAYGAYTPEFPGVGVVADTKVEVLRSIKKAIKMHLEDMIESGKKIPKTKIEVLRMNVA